MTVATETAIDPAPAQHIIKAMSPVGPTDLIPLLQRIQDAYGYLPPAVLQKVSRQTSIPTSRMYGVITFYAQFHLKPHGRHTVRACRGTACHVRGSKAIIESISRLLGVGEGETTLDNAFTFETVACLGTCFLAPVMMVNNDYYGLLTPDKIKSILNKYNRK
jgi:NADH-quinone oxidoreductase subunit E